MPGFLLHRGAIVLCTHGGQAQPTMANPRVKVMGQMVVTQPFPYIIAGCANPPPPAQAGPCTIAQWTVAAQRVKVMGQPVLLRDSQAIAVPTGAPLRIDLTQTRVKGL